MTKKNTLASILAILGVLFITTGATYSFFTYSKDGRRENKIESGSINFHYQEGNRSITLTDAMPMSDEVGMAQDRYFNFTITSKTSDSVKVPYYITVRRKGNDASLDSAVKFYLTEVNNNTENPINLETGSQISKFNELSTYTNDTIGITSAKNEKVLYIGEVPKNTTNYSKDYRLRMWVGSDVTYSQTETGSCSDSTYTTREDCVAAMKDWTDVATSEERTFTVTVNVYAEGEAMVTPSGLVYNVGNVVNIGGTNWYVVENSNASSETVKLMSKWNINKNANSSTQANDLFADESNYSNYVLSYDANGSSSYDSSSVKSFLDGDGKAAIENALGITVNSIGIWGEEELSNLQCTVTWDNDHQYATSLSCDNTTSYYSNIFGAAGSLSTYSWTKLPRSATNNLAIANDGQIQEVSASVSTFGGVRPVIVVNKADINN